MTTAIRPHRHAALQPTRRRWGIGRVIRLGLLAALAGWTLWMSLQRPALHQAEAAFREASALDRKDARVGPMLRNALHFALDDLTTHPRSAASARIAARSFSLLGYADEARPLFKIVESRSPLSAADVDDRVQGLVLENHLDEAELVCRGYLKLHPDDSVVLRRLAIVQWIRRDYEGAEISASKLSGLPGGRADGLSLLATVLHEAKIPERSVPVFESLLAYDPQLKAYPGGPGVFWHEFTDDLIQVHRSAEARDYLLKVVSLYSDPALPDLLGWAQQEQGDTEAAEKSFRESIRRDPGQPSPWLHLGRLFVVTKRFGEAAEVLERAAAISPSNLECHYQLSLAYRFLGRKGDADQHARRAEEIRRTSPTPVGGMGPSR